ncbi:MAG TPA: ferredoxin [Burkholderiales bacterium]|jgi:ferredoxin|nr:ferredoxin [Burkholderiales bacterium]
MSGPITLKVQVAAERCQGHNRCYAIAPELFEIDDYGNARAKGDGTVPPALEEKARLAVKNCPEHAVRLTQKT